MFLSFQIVIYMEGGGYTGNEDYSASSEGLKTAVGNKPLKGTDQIALGRLKNDVQGRESLSREGCRDMDSCGYGRDFSQMRFRDEQTHLLHLRVLNLR